MPNRYLLANGHVIPVLQVVDNPPIRADVGLLTMEVSSHSLPLVSQGQAGSWFLADDEDTHPVALLGWHRDANGHGRVLLGYQEVLN
jgi:hypothetical protein